LQGATFTATGNTGPTGAQGAAGAASNTGSVGTTGYVELQVSVGPTGAFFQWGITPSGNTNSFNITFPTPFPNACDAFFCNNGSNNEALSWQNVTRTTASVSLASASGGNQLYWLAIGH
jgi:hypothetical protein